MKALKLNVMEADNSVNDGIQQVKKRLAIQGDGKARLTIDPSCVNTINEFESYVWQRGKDGKSIDKPVKENDHALDALRYAIATLANTRTFGKPGTAAYA